MKLSSLFISALGTLVSGAQAAASHPATEPALAGQLGAAATDVNALLESPIEQVVDTEADKIPVVGPKIALLLNGFIDQAVEAAEAEAKSKIAELTALKSAITPTA